MTCPTPDVRETTEDILLGTDPGPTRGERDAKLLWLVLVQSNERKGSSFHLAILKKLFLHFF
mgnify:CR=1 FL=1